MNPGLLAGLAASAPRKKIANNRMLVLPGASTTPYAGELFILEISGSDILDVAGTPQPYAFFGVSVNGFVINDGATTLFTVPATTGFMFFDDGATRSGGSWSVTL